MLIGSRVVSTNPSRRGKYATILETREGEIRVKYDSMVGAPEWEKIEAFNVVSVPHTSEKPVEEEVPPAGEEPPAA